jgi:hypothetical protein
MGWWFGRKSVPADARPFVPAWLCSDTAEEGFARSAKCPRSWRMLHRGECPDGRLGQQRTISCSVH